MTLAKLATAIDQRLRKFLRKSYRDGYLETHVRSGIALQIRALREKANMTQEAFADATGKKQSVISRLESTEYGRVNVQTLLDIARARNVALLVRFVDYRQFLKVSADMSPRALGPDDIYETSARAEAAEKTSLLSRLFSAVPQVASQETNRQDEPAPYAEFFDRERQRSTLKQTPPVWTLKELNQTTDMGRLN